MFWNKIIDLRIKSFSYGHIDAIIKRDGVSCRFIGCYGNPRPEKRRFFWELICRLAVMDFGRTPWIVGHSKTYKNTYGFRIIGAQDLPFVI